MTHQQTTTRRPHGDIIGGWALSDTGVLLRKGRTPSQRELAWAVTRLNGRTRDPIWEHGSAGGYADGCRCDKCRSWSTHKRNRKYARANASLPAPNSWNQWTGPELELCLRQDLTVRQLAEMLGRSFYAVRIMRQKVRKEPKYIIAAGGSRQA
jgi:hypothetical protein